jgi:capping protein alpha
MSDLSEEKQNVLRIVKHFLLSSPPGEFEDVLSDVRELVADDELLNKGALDIFHTYNIEQLIPVDVPEQNYKAILCKYGEIDEQTYLDPRKNLLLTVNHAKGVVDKVSDNTQTEAEDVTKKREALQKSLDDYVAEFYLQGVCSVYPSQEGKELIACITGSKFNEKNFWSGRWRSVWRATFEEGGKKLKVVGAMKVNIHYYERGNVQLNTSKDHAETISLNSEDDAPKEIIKVLSKVENTFMREIDTSCTNLADTFKGLRRRLPPYKTLFDFASNAHQLAQTMNK